MRSLPPVPALAVAGALALAGLTAVTTSSATAADTGRPIVALSSTGLALIESTTTAPGTTTTVPIVAAGLGAGETLVGVAFRPANGALYTLGVNAEADNATLYTVSPTTGVLTRVGASNGLVRWTSDGVTPVDLFPPATTGYGIDVNPTVDRIRLVATNGTEALNARINPNDGTPVDGNTNFDNVNPDGSSAQMATASYTNAQAATGGVTTEYALLPVDNTLAVINPPNGGVATLKKEVLLNGTTGLDFTNLAGLDIPSDVTVTTSNTAATGTAYAVLTVGATTGTYSINLATGAATLLATSPVGLRAIAVGELLPPAPAPVVTPATVTKAGKTTVKGNKVTLGITVSCPVGGPACPVKVTIKTRGKKPQAITKTLTKTVAAGTSSKLKVKLNSRGKKLLKSGKVKATVSVTTTSGAKGTSATTKTKIVLKKKQLKKRP